jgi:hypothetical protein
MKLKNLFFQFPNPWALRVSGMGCYTPKCEKKSKSLIPSVQLFDCAAVGLLDPDPLLLSRRWVVSAAAGLLKTGAPQSLPVISCHQIQESRYQPSQVPIFNLDNSEAVPISISREKHWSDSTKHLGACPQPPVLLPRRRTGAKFALNKRVIPPPPHRTRTWRCPFCFLWKKTREAYNSQNSSYYKWH